MTNNGIVWQGMDPRANPKELVGGKGHNLLGLYNFAQESEMFTVPDFYIIPTNVERGMYSSDRIRANFADPRVKETYEAMAKPVIVRSSSPLEDGLTASFAGLFESHPDVSTFDEFSLAAGSILENAVMGRFARRYAERMNIEYVEDMALIVQEQVTGAIQKGTIQIEPWGATWEYTSKLGNSRSDELNFRDLEELLPENPKWSEPTKKVERDWIGEGEEYYAIHCARKAVEALNLEGTVQIEYSLKPGEKPFFYQIRQLPPVQSISAELDLSIPEGVPFMESTCCNGVPGDISLPAYLTVSQAGFDSLSIAMGMRQDEVDKRMYDSTFLHSNDFHDMENINMMYRMDMSPPGRSFREMFNEIWKRGNALFDEYILVCNKLDESIVGMADLTTGKQGIITCNEENKTSHAMTVARDLGIPAMGQYGFMDDPDHFIHKLECGDIVRMKSDGKKAVAYIEKKREKDPYRSD